MKVFRRPVYFVLLGALILSFLTLFVPNVPFFGRPYLASIALGALIALLVWSIIFIREETLLVRLVLGLVVICFLGLLVFFGPGSD